MARRRTGAEIATLGGVQVPGRDDIGALVPGLSADIAVFDIEGEAAAAGALHDPVAALAFCRPPRAQHVVVAGRRVVRDFELTTIELPRLVARHNALARELAAAGGV